MTPLGASLPNKEALSRLVLVVSLLVLRNHFDQFVTAGIVALAVLFEADQAFGIDR